MEINILIYIYFFFVWGRCVRGSVNFTGFDTKNMKGKYLELEGKYKKEYIDSLFLEELRKNNYINNNVIALSTSRHYFNYRHTTNLLITYKYLKNFGDTMDKNILLMIPFDQACDCRNIREGNIFREYELFPSIENKEPMTESINLYDNLNIDYKNNNVRDEQIRRVLRHRYDAFTPKKNRLYSYDNNEKNLFIYMTGHGGVNFLKIQEFNIISSSEFNIYIQELLIKNLYKYIFVIVDTCQGYSFYDDILNFVNKKKINNIFFLSSSKRNENSYSLFSSSYLSVSTVDRFTYHFFNYLEQIHKLYEKEPYKNVKAFSLYNILNYLKTQYIISEPTTNNSKFNSSIFLHDKNILFFNSDLLVIHKDHISINQDKQTNNDKYICLGNLSACGHIKNNVYKKMQTLYEQTLYYNNQEKFFSNDMSYFTDYFFFTYNIFNMYSFFILLLSLFFIMSSLLTYYIVFVTEKCKII
ncbi:GPI8p transamidase [Plasmodium gaboni]|uniref:GPI8p transamidase n=1 Tax=Plasmodium gaboni TaxID=647221 RepID=A0A151LJ43_9APIC|nr:GPI8p transamidase [Plasmodium gaboni]KYN98926.1 GPI8p transamidase [Plasmodium gaboni]